MGKIDDRNDAKPRTRAIEAPARGNNWLRKLDELYRLIFSCLALLFLARLLVGAVSAMGPDVMVGDTLAFYPGEMSSTAPGVKVPARTVDGPWAPPAEACTLDVSAMAQHGGTMTVMAVRPDGVMLSWAGGPTAPAAACRSDEQILVSEPDYQQLLATESTTSARYLAK